MWTIGFEAIISVDKYIDNFLIIMLIISNIKKTNWNCKGIPLAMSCHVCIRDVTVVNIEIITNKKQMSFVFI